MLFNDDNHLKSQFVASYSLRQRSLFSHLVVLALGGAFLIFSPTSANTQEVVIDQARGKEMLRTIKQALKDGYYDPAFRGLDLDAKFKEAEKQISEARSTAQINAIVAQTLLEFDDSHTRFFPPDLEVGVEFGFQMQMIGDTCFVVDVKSTSDAALKGLKVGDIIHAIEGYEPTRASLWKIVYSYFDLMPPPSLRLTTRGSDKQLRELVITPAVFKKKKNIIKLREGSGRLPAYYELSPDIIVCRMFEFDLSDKQVDEMMNRIRPRQVLILDLRGNPGGLISVEKRLLGYFFDKDVVIGDEKWRDKTVPHRAKTRGVDKIFKGKVFVLVDSESGSAAEVFARVMQLEKRGTVIGDRTAGAVMTSSVETFSFKTAPTWKTTQFFLYHANISVADLIMSDGKSLEKAGVTPDVLILPKGEDLARKRDPVMAHAASLAGVSLSPEKAGKIFLNAPTVNKQK